MAEWSKALVLGTSHFGGAGSNPVPVINRSSRCEKLSTVHTDGTQLGNYVDLTGTEGSNSTAQTLQIGVFSARIRFLTKHLTDFCLKSKTPSLEVLSLGALPASW